MKKSFLDNIDWLVKNVKKNNFEEHKELVMVGNFSNEVKKLIGARGNMVYLKPRVYAKINGWFSHWVGHKEIVVDYFYLLPFLIYYPVKIYGDKRNKTVFHFVTRTMKDLDVVIDLFYDKKDDFPQISSIYYIREKYIKNFEEIVLDGGAAVSPSWPILEEIFKNVAGSRLSSLRQNHDLYNRLDKESQEKVLYYKEGKI